MRTIEHEGKVYREDLYRFLLEHYPTGINNLPEMIHRTHARLSSLFVWEKTEEGADYWIQASEEWLRLLQSERTTQPLTRHKHKRLI